MTDDADTLAAAKALILRTMKDLGIEKEEMVEEVLEEQGINKENDNRVPDNPDYPSCDYCGEEFAGKVFCSQCHSAFFCSKECQKQHWKAGHKGDCAKMEEICLTKAESIIFACDEFFGVGVDDIETDFWKLLQKVTLAFDGLGENGPYTKAIELGLNEHLLQLFMFEIRVAKQFLQRGLYLNITGRIGCSLFYSKRSVGNKTVRCIDGYRVKQYVRSNEKAFESWFAASLQAIEIFQTKGLDAFEKNDLDSFWKIEKVAKASVVIWTHVFTNKKAAKAILLGSSKEVDVAAKERAKWIIAHINVITNNFPSIELPDKRVMEFRTYGFTAVILLQMQEFGIDVEDFFQLLQVKGDKKLVYECLAFPMAKGYIKRSAS